MIPFTTLTAYWSSTEIQTSLVIFLNLVGALVLGLAVGYERAYHGRAAGMRTYGLVCMASAALVVIVGYPQQWYGGIHLGLIAADPTRVIQGIVTGVGFLCAGVIMKDGLSITGLTTSASIWASAAIGVMVGVGFYGAAILLALLCMGCMLWVARLEAWLPNRPAIGVDVSFERGFEPSFTTIDEFASRHGYEISRTSLVISGTEGAQEWHLVALARLHRKQATIPALSAELNHMPGVAHFHVCHARN